MSPDANPALRKFSLVIAAVAVMTFFGTSPGRAYVEGPWCAVFSNGGGGVSEDCHYRDFETCRLDIVAGMRGFCNNNPRWPGYHGSPSQGPKKARGRRHRSRS